MTEQTEDAPLTEPGETVPAEQTQSTAPFRRSFRRLRFETGLAVLFTAMGVMVALVLFDTALSARGVAGSTLVSNAFEAFKLIAVTVLGYIFGANQSKSGTEE